VVAMLQRYDARRSTDGATHHRSTVDTAELQQAPDLKPLKINKNNFAGLEAQGQHTLHCCILLVVHGTSATACRLLKLYLQLIHKPCKHCSAPICIVQMLPVSHTAASSCINQPGYTEAASAWCSVSAPFLSSGMGH